LAINPEISISVTDENHRSVEFIVSVSEMEKIFEKNINEFRKQVSMKGFRPGQVPKQLFVSRFGEEVYRETVDRVIQNDLRVEFEKIIDKWKTEEKLEIAAPAECGELHVVRGQELAYKLTIALNKPLTAQGYKDLGVKIPDVLVGEEEINEVIQDVRKRFTKENSDLDQSAQDAEMFAAIGVKDEADFKERVSEDVLSDKRRKARQTALTEAFDKLIELNPFPVLEEQIKYSAERNMQRYHHGHEHEEEFKISQEQLDAMRPEITRAIQEDRIIHSIIEQEQLKPTQAHVDARIEDIAKSAMMDFAAAKDAMRKNGQINKLRETLKIELAENLLIGESLPERAQEKS